MEILIPAIIVSVTAFILAVMLSIASKVFAVKTDETFLALRDELPGANCGACGYKGCDDYAKALSEGGEDSCSKCSVGGSVVADKLATVLGVSAEAEEKKCAVVMCNGTHEASKMIMHYKGMGSCKAAKQLFGGMNSCEFGCIGLGDCEKACKFGAISVNNGVARVHRAKCTSCGVCVRTCKFDAVHVEDHLAYIDPDRCKNCGMCQKECPTGAIINLRLLVQLDKSKAKAKEEAKAKAQQA